MPLMDEFQAERDAIKNGTFKEKFQYFRDYYQWPLIIGIVAVALAGSLIYQVITAKTPVLYVAFFNCAPYDEEDKSVEQGFIEYAEMDPGKYTLTLDSNNYFAPNGTDQASYQSMQKLTTLIGASAIDIMVGGGEAFSYYANTALFQDLSAIMTNEQIAEYKPYFYYVDLALLQNEDGTYKTPEDLAAYEIPDPKKPEEMERPVPVAIFVDETLLPEHYVFSDSEEGIGLAICVNSKNMEAALEFIDYLFE